MQPGDKGDRSLCSPTGVSPGSRTSPNVGGSVDSGARMTRGEGAAEYESETPCSKVLTEEGLKELLYTSCSSDSPEFESVINLYLDQVKSFSEDMASMCCETCESGHLKRHFEPTGVYSKLDLNNFVRLGPSAIGYPSASWKHASKLDGDLEVPAAVVDTEPESQMKLKLRITRETHPTPEDLRNDIVLKMIVVEEVNKKDLMGPLRAYLSPRGEVDFHTSSPGQKEGLEDYLRLVSRRFDGASARHKLDFELVVSAITGCPFRLKMRDSCSDSELGHKMEESCENEPLIDGKPVEGHSSIVVDNFPNMADTIADDANGTESNYIVHQDRENGDQPTSFPSKPAEASHEMGKNLCEAPQPTVKPPLWHRGVDLNEIFSETDSDSGNEDADCRELPTGADLKILRLLRSSSSESNASGMSSYSEDDIDAGLRRLDLEKGDEDGDDEDESMDYDDEDGKNYEKPVGLPDASQLVTSMDETSYAALRSFERPSAKLDLSMSLKDLGLEVIDPMGFNVVSLLRRIPDKQKSPKKSDTVPSKGTDANSTTTDPQTVEPKKKPNQETASKGNTGISKKAANATSLLIYFDNIANTVRPVVDGYKDGGGEDQPYHSKIAVPKDPELKQNIRLEKTVPPTLGKMPEPAPLGFSRHLAPASGSTPPFGSHVPPHGPHPALGAPLMKSNQWFPMLVQVPNQPPSGGPNPTVQPPPKSKLGHIFARVPEEFGQYVANTLYSMSMEQRVQKISLISDVLNQSCADGFAPQNGPNSAQRVQLNTVRPSTRPPFSQNPYSAANQNVTPSPQAKQLNFVPPQNWPPARFPPMQMSNPQLNSAQNSQTKSSTVLLQFGANSEIKNISLAPPYPVPSSRSLQSSESLIQKPKAQTSPRKSESGKTVEIHWDCLKSLKAAKKAAKNSQDSAKFNAYLSSRKSAKAKRNLSQKKKAVQCEGNSPQNATNSSSNGSSSAVPPVKKPEEAKQNQAPAAGKATSKQNQPTSDPAAKQKPAVGSQCANQTSSGVPPPKPQTMKVTNPVQPGKKPISQTSPKKQPKQTQESKPKGPYNGPQGPKTGAGPPTQTSTETGAYVRSRKTQRAQSYKKKQTGQSNN